LCPLNYARNPVCTWQYNNKFFAIGPCPNALDLQVVLLVPLLLLYPVFIGQHVSARQDHIEELQEICLMLCSFKRRGMPSNLYRFVVDIRGLVLLNLVLELLLWVNIKVGITFLIADILVRGMTGTCLAVASSPGYSIVPIDSVRMNAIQRVIVNPLCCLSEEAHVLSFTVIHSASNVIIDSTTYRGALITAHSAGDGMQIPFLLKFMAVFM
jgi:hypothetical protein